MGTLDSEETPLALFMNDDLLTNGSAGRQTLDRRESLVEQTMTKSILSFLGVCGPMDVGQITFVSAAEKPLETGAVCSKAGVVSVLEALGALSLKLAPAPSNSRGTGLRPWLQGAIQHFAVATGNN